jgi:hypothetical protein
LLDVTGDRVPPDTLLRPNALVGAINAVSSEARV